MTPSRREPRLVVGVGVSDGGLEALRELLSALPPAHRMAFILVQHPGATRKSAPAELIAPHTELSVREAEQDVELRGGTVYVVRPGASLAVHGDKIDVSPTTGPGGVGLPVDHLFRSLARDYGPRAAGIVLSGGDRVGRAGLREIKAAGGLTIAQAPSSRRQEVMPGSAIAAGLADLLLEVEEIPAALERFASLSSRAHLEPAADESDEKPERLRRLTEQDLESLAALLEAEQGFDLRVYKTSTLERRVLRRMGLAGFDDAGRYLDLLRRHQDEQQTLVRDLLISVTDFFRDRASFRALREMVIDPLVAQAATGATLRTWVPGCATGEEAYSIGMEFLDAIDAHQKRLSLQMFATDLDQDALAIARGAVYPPSIAEHVSSQRLRTYFKWIEGTGYQVKSELREVIAFSAHDVTRDPPFSRMDLVSCRNLLIYLTPEAQKHVLEVLHFALEPGGCLFLSASESTAAHGDLFATISKARSIYRKVGTSRRIAVARARHDPPLAREGRAQNVAASLFEGRRRQSGGNRARQAVLDAWVPPTIVVSGEGAVLFMHGELGSYLRFPQGESPRLELGSLLRPEIATRARSVLYRCRQDNKSVDALSSPDRRGFARVRITAKPAPDLGGDAVMLTFEKSEEREVEPVRRGESPGQESILEQLEGELQATREDLRNTLEELEGYDEKLRSSNEESLSMNEELQSANEELEATTEELRSLNEELSTVNSQLRDKIDQVEQAHHDLHNFFSSTEIATIFLDEGLCIKRFTPAAGDLLGIDRDDIGRHIADIAREVLQGDLEGEARAVLERPSTRSRELRTSEGRWIARRVLPYRTDGRRVAGVVVTFVDITELKSATERLAVRERQQAMIARLGLQALKTSDLQSFFDHTVREVQQTLGTDYCKILELQPGQRALLLRAGVGWRPGLVGVADVAAGMDSQAGYTLMSSEPVVVDDLAEEKRFTGPPLLVEHDVTSGLSCVIRSGEQVYGVLGAHTRKHRPFSGEDTNFLQAVASVIGSTIARRQTRSRLAVELKVARILAEAKDIDQALSKLLECLAAELHASVGEVWWPDDEGRLSRRLLHVVPPEERARVEERFGWPDVEVAGGLVGRVFSRGSAAWCTDLGDRRLFVRGDQGHELGLVSGLGIPICSGSHVFGVVTAFSHERLIGDDDFLRSLEGIGRSLGDFVLRAGYEQRERRLAAITEAAQDAILSYDLEGTVTEWLPGAERLFGYTAAEMIGSSMDLIVPEDRREELRVANEPILRGEPVDPFETVRVRKDGTLVEVSVRSSPVKDQKGYVVGVSSTDRDITRQKETERNLMEAHRQKDEFLAMLGHELRNPLAAIRSASELFSLIPTEDPQLERTQGVLERQTAHMAKLLDGLLDVSRMIHGQIALELEEVDFAAVCREAVSDLAKRITRRKLTLRADVPPQPLRIEADRVRLAQIVDNLLSNAVKYTPDGGTITLSLYSEEDAAMLKVRDTGVGIEADLLPQIFEVFRQSEQSLDRSYGGLGLGLALVKSLVELHEGSVEAKSPGKGRGSEFVVRLPLPREAAPRPGTVSTGCGALRILLIEDNVDAAEMLKEVLEAEGHQVALAFGGQEGAAMAREEKPDVVLCDLGLPGGMSGFDVAREIRADPDLQGLRLVAVSGYGRSEDLARGKETGFDAHMTKPVGIEALERLLTEIGAGKEPPRDEHEHREA